MSVVLAVDATGANAAAIPKGMQAAGYTTGTGGVPWTAAQWAAHPGAVRICQDPGLSDHTADVADVEQGAGTLAALAGWARAAQGSHAAGARPGQRAPAVYASASLITPVVNALSAGGVTGGVGLWVANWNLTEPQAAADVAAAAGPYPVIGVQYHSGTALDYDVFSAAWLQAVSAAPVPAADAHRHVVPAGNTESFYRIAASRNVTADWLLGFSRPHLSPLHLAALEAQVAAEKACAAAGFTRPSCGAGLVYYTRN